MSADVRSVCAVGATLGEGPAWVARDRALWFVDIKYPRLYRFRPDTGALDHWDAPAQIGWALPAADGAMVAGLQSGLHRFDAAEGTFTLLAAVEPERPGNRLNDATVAPDGILWFGSMDNGEREATGRFYRFDGATVTDSGHPAVAMMPSRTRLARSRWMRLQGRGRCLTGRCRRSAGPNAIHWA